MPKREDAFIAMKDDDFQLFVVASLRFTPPWEARNRQQPRLRPPAIS